MYVHSQWLCPPKINTEWLLLYGNGGRQMLYMTDYLGNCYFAKMPPIFVGIIHVTYGTPILVLSNCKPMQFSLTQFYRFLHQYSNHSVKATCASIDNPKAINSMLIAEQTAWTKAANAKVTILPG